MANISRETLDFIARHKDEDVRQLAFLADKYPQVDMTAALQQIRGRQIATRKLPSWAKVEGVLYAPHLSMEQCSGEHAAKYKGELTRRFCAKSMVDLTGGLGVDFSFMARGMEKALYVERQEHLCELARNNFPLLGLRHAEVTRGEAEGVLRTLGKVDLIYLDPTRRDSSGGKTYAISDCTPDVEAMKEELLRHADIVVIKLSPMLDWHAAVVRMRCGKDGVTEVHVISTDNECKELLLVLSAKTSPFPHVYCVNDNAIFSYDGNETFPPLRYAAPKAGNLLFVPNASIMKAGCFTAIASSYHLKAIGPNSHLFLGEDTEASDIFRIFRIKTVTTLNKKSLRRAIQDIRQANVAVRNFPLTAEALKKKLKVSDGGNTYIFGTTTVGCEHVLLICEKVVNIL